MTCAAEKRYFRWTEATLELVRHRWTQGASDADIAQEFSVSANAIFVIRKRFGMVLSPEQLAELRRARAIERQEKAAGKSADCLHKRQVATLMHLIDLKRAGHSPRFTEFRIGSERSLHMITHRPVDRSYCGSQAAMCTGA